jgi:ferredoxin
MPGHQCTVSFPDTPFPPVVVSAGEALASHLTVQNSPVLFGCRTGICGTCLVKVCGAIPPASEAEQEVLDVLASGVSRARLACQIALTADIELWLWQE